MDEINGFIEQQYVRSTRLEYIIYQQHNYMLTFLRESGQIYRYKYYHTLHTPGSYRNRYHFII